MTILRFLADVLTNIYFFLRTHSVHKSIVIASQPTDKVPLAEWQNKDTDYHGLPLWSVTIGRQR